ncbi:hypothetical protein TOPH_03689 [Tolypocladium ophioglossoides CBS 100239]|uniref:Uncharacterized protein n=1 Tax=Tolypocladium ophioglossoides (strain CBS 100239) TaxID=1163406 RepID=A0A0L0ND25_TOLOC|nr:hypothetical protein TOPH_03689 [Tolypocladium ophioglossoides CBS 100239]
MSRRRREVLFPSMSVGNVCGVAKPRRLGHGADNRTIDTGPSILPNVFGIFQAYYKSHQLPQEGADKIACIGFIQLFLIFAMGAVLRPAAVLYVFAIMMTSFCTKYWQFMPTQGVLTGLANGVTTGGSTGGAARRGHGDGRRGLRARRHLFAWAGMFVPVFLIPTFAITKGVDSSLASYLVAITDGASIFGRVNILIAASAATGLVVLFWPKVEATTGIIAFSAVSGGSVAGTLCTDHPEHRHLYGRGHGHRFVFRLCWPSGRRRHSGWVSRLPRAGLLQRRPDHIRCLAGRVGKYKSPVGLFGKT